MLRHFQTRIKPRSPDYRSYGTVANPEHYALEWRSFYARGIAETAALRAEFRNECNVFYGRHPAHILDIYYPHALAGSAPVLVFLHGGEFREGHPAQYGFLGRPYLERGVIFVCAGYQLAPDRKPADNVNDVAKLIGWIYHNIGARGGDRRRIILSGHSSGATLAALACIRTDWQVREGVPDDVLQSVVLCGATYDANPDVAGDAAEDNVNPNAVGAIGNFARVPARARFAFGLDEINRGDGTRFERSARALAAAMAERGADVQCIVLPNADHQGSCLALSDVGSAVFDATMALLNGQVCADRRESAASADGPS